MNARGRRRCDSMRSTRAPTGSMNNLSNCYYRPPQSSPGSGTDASARIVAASAINRASTAGHGFLRRNSTGRRNNRPPAARALDAKGSRTSARCKGAEGDCIGIARAVQVTLGRQLLGHALYICEHPAGSTRQKGARRATQKLSHTMVSFVVSQRNRRMA